MGISLVVIDFIVIVLCRLLCCAEQLSLWEQALDQDSSQNSIRYPMSARGPAQTDQNVVGFASKLLQNHIESSGPAPVDPWRPHPALVGPSSQELLMQGQGPAQTDQNVVGFASKVFQNRIESRGPAPVAPWRPHPALVGPSSQELLMQGQSQRTNYAPVPLPPSDPLQSRVNFGLNSEQTFSQTQQGFHGPIPGLYLFPEVKDEVVMGPEFEPEVPEPANSVTVHCGEVSVEVQVKQDFLGNDQFINPSDLTLGGCPSVGFDDLARIVAFESALQGCGSTLTMTEDSLVYNFVLVYSPSPLPNTPIVKTNDAMVAIHCIYPRKQNVSSNALLPTWVPYTTARAGEEYLRFSLKLMSDDWQYERPMNTYFLGDFINFEASVVRANHVPLRVFVESCAATLGPSGDATTVYTFIGNSGCMLDAKLTNSRSRFMPRIQDNKLQFQIEALRFQQDSSGLIYITCHLKATTTSRPIDAINKACSFDPETSSWTAVNGDDQVCGCCESRCAMRKGRSLDTDDSTLEDEATIGPIFVQKRQPLLQIQESYQVPSKDPEFSIELVLVTGLVVAVSVLCVIILGTLFYRRRQKQYVLYV